MYNIKNFYSIFFLSISLLVLSSCVDDEVLPAPPVIDEEIPKGVPEDMLAGPCVTFKVSLGEMGGESKGLTRAETVTNEELRRRENYIDLEKLRVLFFTYTGPLDEIDNTGKYDVFLFESKSRWVSILSDEESTSAQWQVTAPVFKYGNNDDYDWKYVRDCLTTRPFKVAILANRPERIIYGDYDDKLLNVETSEFLERDEHGEIYFGNRGPYWGPAESNAGRDGESGAGEIKTINDLHHCQWDPVYAGKNSGFGYYDFIMDIPSEELGDTDANQMGAVSAWTYHQFSGNYGKDANGRLRADGEFKSDGTTWQPYNYYRLPDYDQPIPMYGVQRFAKIEGWKEGTPFNISERLIGTNATYERKNIHLLRSVARIDLIIPKNLGEVTDVLINYPNVFARCEPLDVATPTEEIWEDDHTNCEWHRIFNYGPIVNWEGNKNTNKDLFHQRMAWFYGTWRSWWHFNSELVGKESYFNMSSTEAYPKIYNPCIQRNGNAKLDNVVVNNETDDYYHYAVYTGEKNINDPSKFDKLIDDGGELTYFSFKLNGKPYIVFISDYPEDSNFRKYMKGNTTMSGETKKEMSHATEKKDWNWPILRNHIYTFRITKIDGNVDGDGLDVKVISSEDRSTDWIEFK